MRSTIVISALSALAAAVPAPVPQDIDFDLVYALPEPTYSIAVGVASQVISYDPSTVIDNAVPQITAEVSATADLNITSAATSATVTTAPATLQKRNACDPQPTGATGAPTLTADTPSAFTDSAAFSSIALNAPVPSGFVQRFSNLKASNNAYGYMGFTTLQTYDTNACAKKCTAMKGCSNINIYFERDPSVEPAAACSNPPSYTMIKCVFWGGPVTTENAVNSGQWRNKFQVVIAGSNGYESALATPPGYSDPVTMTGAINAPYDTYGFDSYMGVALFNSGPFDLKLCADACSLKSQYALAHPPTDGSPVVTCQFFNTYILYINNTQNPQGQYCAMYAESWPAKYATNVGQYRGNDYFLIRNSYAVSNATDPGTPVKARAVYQASKDIAWSTLQPYCSTAVATAVTTTSTISISTTKTPTSTVTATVTVSSGHAKRDYTNTTTTSLPTLPVFVVGVNQTKSANFKRDVSTPAVLTKYPATIVASACALYSITGATATATAYSTCTSTAAVAITKTITVTVTSAPVTTTAVSSTTNNVAATTSSPCAGSTTTSVSTSSLPATSSTTTSCTLTTSSPAATSSTTTSCTSTTSSAASSSPATTSTVPTTSSVSSSAASSPSTTLSSTTSSPAAATPTSFYIQVYNGTSTGQYITNDPFTTTDSYNLYTLTDRAAAATLFTLSSAASSALIQVANQWKIQGALTSGLAYGGWGASPYGFDNGEDLICRIVPGGISGGDGKGGDEIKCVTPSNGHDVFGECLAYSWMWLFDTVAEVNSFCPGGTGALGFRTIDASALNTGS